jgi:hypothetical protein
MNVVERGVSRDESEHRDSNMNSNTDRVETGRTRISFILATTSSRMRGASICFLCFPLSPPRLNLEPDRLLRDSFRCEFRAAARVPPSFAPLTSVDLFRNSRLRLGGAYAAVAGFVAELVKWYSVRLIGALCISVLSSRGRRRTRESSWPVTGKDWFRLRVAAAGMLIYPHPKSLPTGLPSPTDDRSYSVAIHYTGD